MNNSIKKPMVLFTVLAGIGLFLPLVKASVYGVSVNISFFDGADGKIILGILVVALIVILVEMNNDKLGLRIFYLLLIVGAAVVFFIDTTDLSKLMKYSSSALKYGIGYYISLIGLIISFGLSVFELVLGKHDSNYHTEYVVINTPPNQSFNQVSNNIPPVNKPVENTNIEEQTMDNNNQVKLSDLVNHNELNNNPTNSNNHNNTN